jgi:opacity protein-like surface antigen
MKRGCFIVMILFVTFGAMSQSLIDQAQGYVGPVFFPPAKNNELLSGFNTGYTLGAGVAKSLKHNLFYEPNIEFTGASKDHFAFSLLSLRNNLKYYPLSTAKVRPYVMVMINISFINLHQSAYQTPVVPDPSYSGIDPANTLISQIIYREPDIKVQFAPTIGAGAGVGVDIPMKWKAVPFIQYAFTNYFSKASNVISQGFSNNTTNLVTQGIQIGLRYNFAGK